MHFYIFRYHIRAFLRRYEVFYPVCRRFFLIYEKDSVRVFQLIKAVSVSSGVGFHYKFLFFSEELQNSVGVCPADMLRTVLQFFNEQLSVLFTYEKIIAGHVLFCFIKYISHGGLVIYPLLVPVVYPVKPGIIIIGENLPAIFFCQAILLYSVGRKSSFPRPYFLSQRCGFSPDIVLHQVQPSRQHIFSETLSEIMLFQKSDCSFLDASFSFYVA